MKKLQKIEYASYDKRNKFYTALATEEDLRDRSSPLIGTNEAKMRVSQTIFSEVPGPSHYLQ
jgi:hypothetical protein